MNFHRKEKEKLSELKIVCPGIFKSVLSNIALTGYMWLFKFKLIKSK